MLNGKPIRRIGTHDGRFHTDELYALAILLILFPQAQIIRTRDKRILATCDIRVDVGERYDPTTGDFDHHGLAPIQVRENGIQYSSFGLVWREYGLRICENRSWLADLIDIRLVQPIDASDNGQFIRTGGRAEFVSSQGQNIKPISLPNFLSTFNVGYDDHEKSSFSIFMMLVELLQSHLKATMRQLISIQEAKPPVVQSITQTLKQDDQRVLVLDDSLPWIETLFNFEETSGRTDISIAVLPNNEKNSYMIQCVPESFARDQKKRISLPVSWQTDQNFQMQNAITSVNIQRAMLWTRTRENAIRLAQMILDQKEAA